jgi:hypothetical protein
MTKSVVADIVFHRLRSADGAEAALLKNAAALPFAYLGALGGDFADLIPGRPETGAAAPNTPHFQVWLRLLDLFAGRNAAGATVHSPAREGFRTATKIVVDIPRHDK